MTRHRFECISAFLHVVTAREEADLQQHPLRKILPLYKHMKQKCQQFYQPLREISIDERMVQSKARTRFRQYMRNKPTKWGFKFWVLADSTGYTCDFNLYYGQRNTDSSSGHGLSYDVVKELLQHYHNQGYYLFVDNFYTSPVLVDFLKGVGIRTTGTLRVNRKNVPTEVKELQAVLKGKHVPRGSGYYIRPAGSSNVYVCWRDSDCVTLMSNAYPGHEDGTVKRRGKDGTGASVTLDVPLPSVVKHYNKFMGGVDKSDQLISYHRVTRQTKRYWKTLFFHMIEIAVTNAYILHKMKKLQSGLKTATESEFRDQLVLQIIEKYGFSRPIPTVASYQSSHGSKAFPYAQRGRCVVCQVKTARRCPDCPFTPCLCQTSDKDCHGIWHSEAHLHKRMNWFLTKRNTYTRLTNPPTKHLPSKRGPGRPKGSKDKRKRKKN